MNPETKKLQFLRLRGFESSDDKRIIEKSANEQEMAVGILVFDHFHRLEDSRYKPNRAVVVILANRIVFTFIDQMDQIGRKSNQINTDYQVVERAIRESCILFNRTYSTKRHEYVLEQLHRRCRHERWALLEVHNTAMYDEFCILVKEAFIRFQSLQSLGRLSAFNTNQNFSL